MPIEILHVPASDLVPYEKNPRTITDKKRASLQESLKLRGLFKPLLFWLDPISSEKVIVGGNQRIHIIHNWMDSNEVPESVDVDAIPVVEFEGTRAEAAAVALADNSPAGDWDWDLLPAYTADLRNLFDDDVDLAVLTQFDDNMLSDLDELASSADLDLDRFTGAGDPTPTPVTPPPVPDPPVGRKFARYRVGNISAQIPIEQYGRFLEAWKAYSERLDTTDVPTIVEAMMKDAEAGRA